MSTNTPTDLDRLHDVSKMLVPPRRAGKTTYDCHLVAGAIEVGESLLAVVVPRMDWLQHIQPILNSVLEEHELAVKRRRQKEWIVAGPSGDARVMFLSASRPESLRGFGVDLTVVDFDDDDPRRYEP